MFPRSLLPAVMVAFLAAHLGACACRLTVIFAAAVKTRESGDCCRHHARAARGHESAPAPKAPSHDPNSCCCCSDGLQDVLAPEHAVAERAPEVSAVAEVVTCIEPRLVEAAVLDGGPPGERADFRLSALHAPLLI